MEDLFGIVAFLIFVGLSFFGRIAKNAQEQEKRRQAPQMPGQRPQPQPAPMQREVRRTVREERQPWERQERVTPPLAPTAARRAKVDAGGEGVSTMLQGERPSVEGRGRNRRQEQIEQMRSRRTQSAGRGIGQALQNRETAAQAIVLGEVLGHPLAMRDRRRK